MFSRRLLPYFQGESLKARLARGAVGAFSINVAGLGLALLVNLVLARTIGPEWFSIHAPPGASGHGTLKTRANIALAPPGMRCLAHDRSAEQA